MIPIHTVTGAGPYIRLEISWSDHPIPTSTGLIQSVNGLVRSNWKEHYFWLCSLSMSLLHWWFLCGWTGVCSQQIMMLDFASCRWHKASEIWGQREGALFYTGFPGDTGGKGPACQWRKQMRHGFDLWAKEIPWRRAWPPTLIFLAG